MRKIIFYKHYFMEFYNSLDENVQKKIEWTLGIIRDLKYVPEKYFKHLTGTDGLFEIRVQVSSNSFRIFSFYDEGELIILLNGLVKKSNKLNKNEISKALKLKKEYLNEKERNK